MGKRPRAVTSSIVKHVLCVELTWDMAADRDERVSYLRAAVEPCGSGDIIGEWPKGPKIQMLQSQACREAGRQAGRRRAETCIGVGSALQSRTCT